jgi:methylated-DNA-protein-cysteine methyltransferase-like protein
VRRIPRGKVLSYGQVAGFVGRPRAARAVGIALGALQGGAVDDIPWQRVIGSGGRPSHRDGFWAGIQRDLLEAEGVRFDASGKIDLARAQWAGPRSRRVPAGAVAAKSGGSATRRRSSTRRRRRPSSTGRRGAR